MKTHLLTLFLLAILFSSCDKQENITTNDMYKGKIIGYLKCSDNKTDNTIFGVFIITNKKDSLLSFNILSENYDLNTNDLDYGINFLNGDSIQFSCKNANSNEQKVFDCPPSTTFNPSFYNIENFTQVIITDMDMIK